MSNISTFSNSVVAQEQLFTELTAEEGATISGGTLLRLKYFTVTDTQEWPRDEVYLKADNQTIWSKGGVGVGTHTVNKYRPITGASDTLRLFEDDAWPSNDEFLGENTIYAGTRGRDRKAHFTRKGANYTLVYDAF